MSLQSICKVRLGKIDCVAIRLTNDDALALISKLNEIVATGTGVSFVFERWTGELNVVITPEHGTQLAFDAFQGLGQKRMDAPLRGYNGRWSHVNFYYPLSAISGVEQYVRKAHAAQDLFGDE